MSSEKIEILENLKKELISGKMSVMIGAGFSKNAKKEFPSWDELLYDMVLELYEDEIEEKYFRYLNYRNKQNNEEEISKEKFEENAVKKIIQREGYLEIVSKYIKLKGRKEAISIYIENKFQKIDKCNEEELKIHKELLLLNWNNVYTTNYDTLLEQANEEINYKYEKDAILNSSDLSIGNKNRIIKVHGTLRKEDRKEEYGFDNDRYTQYIISKEDYEEYPKKHEAFTQLMRIALLQEKFMLVGFSGNDPNFTSWVNWVQDILIKNENKEPKIYLIDIDNKPISEELGLWYKNMGIQRICLLEDEIFNFLNKSSNNISSKIQYSEKIKISFENLFLFLYEENKEEFINLMKSIYNKTKEQVFAIDNVIKDYERLKKLYYHNRLNYRSDVRDYCKYSLSNLTRKYDFVDSQYKLKYFGLISFLINFNLLPICLSIDEKEINKLTEIFDTIDYNLLDNEEKKEYHSFLFVLLDNNLILNEKYKFSLYFDRLNTKNLDNEEKHKLTYYKLLFYAINLDYKNLIECIDNWKPEENIDLNFSWVIKKIGLMSYTKIPIYYKKSLELLEELEKNIDNKPISEQLWFYEFVPFFHRKYDENMKDIYFNKRNHLRQYNLIKISDLFGNLKKEEKKEDIKPSEKKRHLISFSHNLGLNDETKRLMDTIRLIKLSFESGFPFNSNMLINIKEEEWFTNFKNIYFEKDLFYLSLFLTLQYYKQYSSDFDLFEKIMEEIIKIQKDNKQLLDLFKIVEKNFWYYYNEKKELRKDFIVIITSLFNTLPYNEWKNFFNEFWKLIKNNEVQLYTEDNNYNKKYLISFVEKSLVHIEEKELLINLIEDFIKLKENDEVKTEFINHILNNKNIRLIENDINKKLDYLIDNLENNPYIYFKKINLFYKYLDENQKEKIYLKINDLLNSKNYREIFYYLLYFSKSDKNIHNKIKENLLNEKDLWDTGFDISEEAKRCIYYHYGVYYIFPYKITKKSIDFQNGLEWSNEEINKIYDKLLDIIKKINKLKKSHLDDFEFHNYSLIQEMLRFLDEEREFLQSRNDYVSTYEELKRIYKEITGFDNITNGLLSDNEKTVIMAYDELNFGFYDFDKRYINDYKLLINKIIFKKEPKLEAGLDYFCYILERHKDNPEIKNFIEEYKLILNSYKNLEELINYDISYIFEKLVRIAKVLKEWGVKDDIIEEWQKKKEATFYNNVRYIDL